MSKSLEMLIDEYIYEGYSKDRLLTKINNWDLTYERRVAAREYIEEKFNPKEPNIVKAEKRKSSALRTSRRKR